MKISKASKTVKPTKAASNVEASENVKHLENVSAKSKDEAYAHVKCAIECLMSCAKDDDSAKESIANLSVVALSLK